MSTNMEIIVNGQPRQVTEGITIAELLTELQLSDKPVAVEVNLILAPKHKHAEHRLAAGDRLEVVTLVGGG
jgi:sulfur carrier protein